MVQSQAIIENGLEWTGAFKTRFGVSVGYRLGIVFGIGLTQKIPDFSVRQAKSTVIVA